METKKKIVSVVASLAMLTSVSGLSAFAANCLTEAPEEAETVVAEAETGTEAAGTESETEAVLEEIAEEVPEAIAKTLEDIEPGRPVGKHEILAKIDEVFDFDAQDFKDDDAKATWFAFCEELKASEPQKPADDKIAPPAPVEDEEITPPAPVEGEEIAPPAPAEDEKIAPPAPAEDEKIAPPAPAEDEKIAPPAPGEGPALPPAPPVAEDGKKPIPPHLRDQAPAADDAETVDAE